MKKRLEARVTGRVQLVMFRDFVQRSARKLRLAGFVRNDPDGSVEIVAEGEEESLRELERKLHKGSVLSSVEQVHAKYVSATGEFRFFDIHHE